MLQQQIHAHDVDARLTAQRNQSLLAAIRTTVDIKCRGNGGTGNVRIHHRRMFTPAAELHRQHGGNGGFSHAALTADDANDLFHAGQRICLRQQALCLTAGAAFAAGGTLPAAILAHSNSSFLFYDSKVLSYFAIFIVAPKWSVSISVLYPIFQAFESPSSKKINSSGISP